MPRRTTRQRSSSSERLATSPIEVSIPGRVRLKIVSSASVKRVRFESPPPVASRHNASDIQTGILLRLTQFQLDLMILVVVTQVDDSVSLVDAIDGDAFYGAARGGLQDGDVEEGLSVAVVEFE